MARRRYTFATAFSPETGSWHGTCAEWPGVTSTADTRERALEAIKDGVDLTEREFREAGLPVPEPRPKPRYAGRGGRRRGKPLS